MSPSSHNIHPEARQAIAVLRALTVSRKDPASLRELMREYRNLEGSNINYHKYGFPSLEDLIVSSGEFVVNRIQGETCLSAKPSKDSAHISEMVRRQRAVRKKSSTPPFRRPLISDQSWNKSSYSSNVFSKLSSVSSAKRKVGTQSTKSNSRKTGDSNNNNNQANWNTHIEKKINKQSKPVVQQQPKQKEPQQKSSNNSNSSKTVIQKSQSQQDLRERLNAKVHATNTFAAVSSTTKFAGNANNLQDRLQRSQSTTNQPPKYTSNQSVENKSNQINQTPKTEVVEHNTQLPSSYLSSRLQRIANNAIRSDKTSTTLSITINPMQKFESAKPSSSQQNSPQIQSPVTPETQSFFSRKMSIQDRLKVAVVSSNGNGSTAERGDSPRIISNTSVIDKELNKTKQTESKPIPLVFSFNPKMDPMTSLAQYCTFKKYNPPEYNCLKPRFSGLYQCKVLVNGVIYSTYPNEYPTEALAQVACAATTIEQIKVYEDKKQYPVCTDSDVELAMKIHQELKNHPQGIFCKNIPEMFQNTFEKALPEHWISIIQSSNQFVLESTAGDNMIVYPNCETTESSAGSTTSEPEFIVLDKITLPWENKHWNLYITSCISTVEIWARLVGKEYSDQLDSLMTDIEIYMYSDKTRAASITTGQIYLVSVSECWHRVRVEEMNKGAGDCLCFFIDFGDEEWLSMDQLFVCEPRFLKLPPQAIPFSLFGLEDFAENPNAKPHLDQMLIGKSLVGEILTKKDVFESNNSSSDDFVSKIQVALYDTSSSEDVNLNPLLLNKICNDTPPPELKKTGVTNVNITHIASNGEIYLQVRNPGLLYVQKLINQLVESKFKEDQHKVTAEDMKKSNNIFLVQDADDNRWYRGALAQGESIINDSTYNIFYVDYGATKATNISNIFRLDSLSAALSKFPRQVIKAKLFNIPPVNDSIVARIKGLLPPECPAIIKLAVNAVVPSVNVYRRFDVNEGLFNVNEVIQIEYEVENYCDSSENEKNVNSLNAKSKSISPSSSVMSEMTAVIRGISLKSPITVPNSPQRGDLPKLSSNVFIPGPGQFYDVLVTMASNPNNFVVQPYNDGPKLVEMMNELQEYCVNNDEFIPTDMLELGQGYAALNSDGNYHRVTIENIFDSSMIHVHYCDFGDIAVISNEKLKTLPAKFRNLPKQAIAAKLYGVKPKHVDWTLEDCMRFKELTVGQKFVSVVKNITSDAVCPNTRILELQLIDVSTDEDIYIHEVLINEGRAVLSS